jgi:GT2 family glycosyltransferase
MPEAPRASILVCTRDRAASLAATLAALGRLEVPADTPAELVVVDNASTDTTPEVVAACRLGFPVRTVHEPRPGVARARNAGLAAARGDILLFLDDDVRPPPHWLVAMTRPILAGTADAVAGGVRLAPDLRRPWMEPLHTAWLAETHFLDTRAPGEMVSASMAFARRVLDAVPGFDPELGPGALGQGEDSLFSWQLLHAGFRIAAVLEVEVEHHPEPARLLREAFRATATRRGRTMAYQKHHWEHTDVPAPRLRWMRQAVRLARFRRAHRAACAAREGMPPWEMLALERLAFLRHWPAERRRPRNYERFGLVKRVASG